MSTANKSIVFLLLTFAISWGVTIGGWKLGFANSPFATFATLTAMMAGPAIAALVCTFAFEKKGQRIDALGLRFRPNAWWLWAAFIPAVMAVVAVAVTAITSPYHLADPAQGVIAIVQARASPEQVAKLRAIGPSLGSLLLVQVVFGMIFNAIALTFTEELGWRGYLYSLWRPSGFWRTALATGAIWGVWHAPAIYLYGLNYPDHRLIGIPIFIAFCTLLAPLMTLIRDRGGSTWAAGIAHGAINAIAGYAALWLAAPQFPWMGTVGIGGFVALGLALVGVIAARPGLAPRPAAA